MPVSALARVDLLKLFPQRNKLHSFHLGSSQVQLSSHSAVILFLLQRKVAKLTLAYVAQGHRCSWMQVCIKTVYQSSQRYVL